MVHTKFCGNLSTGAGEKDPYMGYRIWPLWPFWSCDPDAAKNLVPRTHSGISSGELNKTS